MTVTEPWQLLPQPGSPEEFDELSESLAILWPRRGDTGSTGRRPAHGPPSPPPRPLPTGRPARQHHDHYARRGHCWSRSSGQRIMVLNLSSSCTNPIQKLRQNVYLIPNERKRIRVVLFQEPSQPRPPGPARPGMEAAAAVEIIISQNVLRFVLWPF